MELLEKIKSIFSVHGEYNRLQYLLYGIVIPLLISVLIGVSAYFIPNLVIILIIALYLMFIAMIKRARDTKYNTTLLIVLGLMPYVGLIAQLFLFFAPHGEKDTNSSSKLVTILVVVFIIVILGILTAVAIPKLQETRHNAEIAKEQVQLQQGKI